MTAASHEDQTPTVSAQTERWILFATVLASAMAFIDGTALNVALPAMQTDLGASGAELLWILNSYALLVAALILVGGSLGDRFGRRRVYVAGIVLFSAASLACGFAENVRILIAARAVQGIGGALLIPGSLSVLTSAIDPKRRGQAIGTWSAFSVITAASGPVLGGILANAGLWRYVFFINLPLAVVAVVVLYLKAPETRDNTDRPTIDYCGAFLATLGLVSINFALIQAADEGWNAPWVFVALTVGLVSVPLFLTVEAYSKYPFLPLHLFRSPNFTAAVILTLAFYSGLYGMLFFFSLNLIQIQGYNPALAGLTQLPIMILVVALSRWAGGLADRYGPRLPLTIGPGIAGVGFLLFALPGLTNGPPGFWKHYLPPLSLLGIAMGVTVAPLSSTMMGSVARNKSGLASGINSGLARLSSVLGIAVLGPLAIVSFGRTLESQTVSIDLPVQARAQLSESAINLGETRVPPGLAAAATAEIQAAIRQSFVDSFRKIACVCAAAVWAGAALAMLLIEQRSVPADQVP